MKKIRIRKFLKTQRLILMAFVILITLGCTITLGRFIYNRLLDFYFASKNFYFESDKLKATQAKYSLDYWNGVDPYNIVVNLNSYKNSSLKSTSDITYNVSYSCSSNVTCSSSKSEGTIYASSNTDSFVISMAPNVTLNDGDSATVEITANSTSPYKKTLSAQFKLVVGKYGLSHEIVDSVGNVYFEVKVTNSLDYYTVKEAFDSYSVGDKIQISTYNALSDTNKAKCVSAKITMSFNPNVVYVNNNSTSFLNVYDVQTEQINNFDYINQFSFNVAASSSNVIKFYKKNVNNNYTHAGSGGVVEVSYDV